MSLPIEDDIQLLTEDELDALAEVTEDDMDSAAEWWDRLASPEWKGILNAAPEEE